VALDGIDLDVAPGERLAVLGPSGAGKSTLMALLNGSLPPSSGTVEVLGAALGSLSEPVRRRVQTRIGTVGQRLDLIEQVRVLHNVNAGRLARWGTWRSLLALAWPRPDEEVTTALDRVGLGWAVHEHTGRLSGGERQRVAIARVLVQRPDLVLADEPVSSLDPVRAAEVLNLIQSIDGAHGPAASLVSLHQPALARAHCTRAVGLRAGRIVFDEPVANLAEHQLDALYGLV
jgi:phosphonate transport system ATP-binding protein